MSSRNSKKDLHKQNYIERARKIHSDRYNYDRVIYENATSRVEIVCPMHGSFFVSMNNHTTGKIQGCEKCRKDEHQRKHLMAFIEQGRIIHNNKYNYDDLIYVDSSTKVEIGCPIHGKFIMKPNNHISNRQGCPKCGLLSIGDKNRSSRDEIIARFNEVHRDCYDYSLVDYKSSAIKVGIICGIHGKFSMTPGNHISGNKCPKCARISAAQNTSHDFDDFVNKARKKHGDRFKYYEKDFVNITTDMRMVCDMHGDFYQQPKNHYRHIGCTSCGRDNIVNSVSYNLDEFIKNAVAVHGDRYSYEKAIYTGSSNNTEIICKNHGSFWATPANHVNHGSGCPKCGRAESKWETELGDWVASLGFYCERTRKVITPYELDIFIPDKKFAIEADGLYFHSEKFRKTSEYHLKKTLMCEKLGITLFHIFQDEWLYKKEVVKSLISLMLDKTSNKILASECEVKEVCRESANKFLEENHIRPNMNTIYNIGLYFKDELVSLMIFGKSVKDNNYEWELLGFCNKSHIDVTDAQDRMLKFFKKHKNPTSVISYSDKRFDDAKIYNRAGFINNLPDSGPNYWYVNSGRVARYIMEDFKDHKLPIFDPALLEHENMKNNGYYRIWDCGNKIYTWNRE